ncbi:MAG: (S)-ureidoglycine aminohydrolase [Bryobacterales bacterium]|nr:(S)-ureidoglycine aminohydrolase [Bryobacterales bacterium]
MHNLGHTRTSRQHDHFLLTPDTFVRAAPPGMRNATAIVHAAPAGGAAFTEYTVEFEAGGVMQAGGAQMFLYVLDGAVTVNGQILGPAQYAYVPADRGAAIQSERGGRAIVIEKPQLILNGEKPNPFTGDERTVAPTALGGDEALEVRTLIPPDFAFDFAVNTMTFLPGAALPMVEVHVMEHGLLMLEGSGIYRLNDNWYPVTAGDFIWMGSYCPQWFGALGKTPAKYLIYKDWNRHPLHIK